MDEIFQIQLDKTSEVPMYRQLADAIGALAADGLLPADSKLPPIRKMAAHFGVNTVTVVTAYKYLEQKQMVYSRVGSGTYISPLPVEKVPEPVARRNLQLFEKTPALEHAINFTLSSLPNELFPVDAFKKAFDTVLEREKGGAFRYTDSMGYLPLRLLASIQRRSICRSFPVPSKASTSCQKPFCGMEMWSLWKALPFMVRQGHSCPEGQNWWAFPWKRTVWRWKPWKII